MVVGIGIDIVSIKRIEDVVKRFDNRFIDRIFTKEEQKFLKKIETIAGRFAAKEAAFKAYNAISNWHDVEVRGGKIPFLRLNGVCVSINPRVSITHDAGVAAAVVVIDKGLKLSCKFHGPYTGETTPCCIHMNMED